MRVVLDTNVLISALLGSSRQPSPPPARVLTAWRAGRFEVVTSVAQLDEIKRVLSYQKIRARLTEALANALSEDFFNVALVMADVPEVLASPDPDDDMLLGKLCKSRRTGGSRCPVALKDWIPAFAGTTK